MSVARPTLTDRAALDRHRARARALGPHGLFLQKLARAEVEERLKLVNRVFTKAAVVTAFSDIWAGFDPAPTIIADTDRLDLEAREYDLVIHAMSMHWADDPVGQIIQSARALTPDGLFLGCLFAGRTLTELRSVLTRAEAQISGGAAPRVAPMADIRDLGGLLQRAGLALPVADLLSQTVTYPDLPALMRDLRAMGETNALAARHRPGLKRAVLQLASQIYQSDYPAPNGGISATFDIVFLSGWAPHPNQPQPLRPGAATQSLAAALARAKSEPPK